MAMLETGGQNSARRLLPGRQQTGILHQPYLRIHFRQLPAFDRYSRRRRVCLRAFTTLLLSLPLLWQGNSTLTLLSFIANVPFYFTCQCCLVFTIARKLKSRVS